MTVDFASSDSLASLSEFVLKVVLTNYATQTNEASSQIRKVQLHEIFDSDNDRKPSYAKLEERISFFLGLDVYKMFLTLTYRDEENDCIRVSSSVELEYAIQQFSNHSSTMTLEGVATASAEAIEIRKLKEQLARQREEAEQNLKDMKDQVDNLREQLDSKHQEVEQAVNAFKKEQDGHEKKKKEVDDLRNQLDIKHRDVEQAVNAFKKEQNEHEKKTKEVDDLRHELHSKCLEVQQAVNALKKEQDEREKTKKALTLSKYALL